MKKSYLSIFAIATLSIVGCKQADKTYDASGTFEADEIMVAAEGTGRILTFSVAEGAELTAGQAVGTIDGANVSLQKEQIAASITALSQKTNDAAPQVAVLERQMETVKGQVAIFRQQITVQQREQKRVSALIKADAATPKQLDDINGAISVLEKQIDAANDQIPVLQRQMEAQRAAVDIQNRGILSERDPLQKRISVLDDQLAKTRITNPIAGTVIAKYANVGEITTLGKTLYKIADLSNLTLRAYITGDLLPKLKLNQTVKILVDAGDGKQKELQGTVYFISPKAEFTPKTIQTKSERANLVYALKIKVKNDGYLKLGMYGEVVF
jgi:HlyD family secretion protein